MMIRESGNLLKMPVHSFRRKRVARNDGFAKYAKALLVLVKNRQGFASAAENQSGEMERAL